MISPQEIIDLLQMQPLPVEGGYYAVTHHSSEKIVSNCLPDRYQNDRSITGSIYFLATSTAFSALHKLITDEQYFYHMGDPLEMLLLGPEGKGAIKQLGIDLDAGQQPQLLAPRNWWQGSRPLPGGSFGFTLISTSMSPAYEESDIEFGNREQLSMQYPGYAEMITSLTRS
jgi:predicted cupin superfamily sugar epimerase